MADEPKPQPESEQAPHSNISPAPTEITDAEGTAGAAAPPKVVQDEANTLADGTAATVLAPGQSHRHVAKGAGSFASLYRRADVVTTLVTFVGALVASGLVIGGYVYLTQSKSKTAPPPKITSLDKADLSKLNAFFEGNSAGNSAQILTFSSSTVFKERAAFMSDLKVVAGIQVGGPTVLGDLTVDKTSTLGVTNVRGQLTVTGPVTFQSPTQLGAGGTVNGNFTVSGNGSFGGSLSGGSMNITNLTVSGNLNLSGHIAITGQSPSATPAAGVVTSATVSGNDSGGTVTVNLSAIPVPQNQGNTLVTITFRTPYSGVPRIIISPIGRGSAVLQPYVIKTANSFTIGASILAANPNPASYGFDYWVVQ